MDIHELAFHTIGVQEELEGNMAPFHGRYDFHKSGNYEGVANTLLNRTIHRIMIEM